MPMCEPTPIIRKAVTTKKATFSGFMAWYNARKEATKAAEAAHPADVASKTKAACAFNPAGCTCKTEEVGPIENVSTTIKWRWLVIPWTVTVTVTYSTEVIARFFCDTVPDGAKEYVPYS